MAHRGRLLLLVVVVHASDGPARPAQRRAVRVVGGGGVGALRRHTVEGRRRARGARHARRTPKHVGGGALDGRRLFDRNRLHRGLSHRWEGGGGRRRGGAAADEAGAAAAVESACDRGGGGTAAGVRPDKLGAHALLLVAVVVGDVVGAVGTHSRDHARVLVRLCALVGRVPLAEYARAHLEARLVAQGAGVRGLAEPRRPLARRGRGLALCVKVFGHARQRGDMGARAGRERPRLVAALKERHQPPLAELSCERHHLGRDLAVGRRVELQVALGVGG